MKVRLYSITGFGGEFEFEDLKPLGLIDTLVYGVTVECGTEHRSFYRLMAGDGRTRDISNFKAYSMEELGLKVAAEGYAV